MNNYDEYTISVKFNKFGDTNTSMTTIKIHLTSGYHINKKQHIEKAVSIAVQEIHGKCAIIRAESIYIVKRVPTFEFDTEELL
jgi:hypothetical membrane protein